MKSKSIFSLAALSLALMSGAVWGDHVPGHDPVARSGIAGLRADLDAEIAARLGGDAALQGQINAEAALRDAGDTALKLEAEQETAARIAADEALQTAIDEIELTPGPPGPTGPQGPIGPEGGPGPGPHYVMIPASGFTSLDRDDDCLIFGSAALCSPPPGHRALLYAPIHIPNGAEITEVTCWGRDVDPVEDWRFLVNFWFSPDHPRCSVFGPGTACTSGWGGGGCDSSGPQAGETASCTLVGQGTLITDYSNSAYHITFSLPSLSDINDVRLNACRVTYML